MCAYCCFGSSEQKLHDSLDRAYELARENLEAVQNTAYGSSKDRYDAISAAYENVHATMRARIQFLRDRTKR